MFLDLTTQDYIRDIVPFLRNGILIDTSVILDLIEGIISTRISKKKIVDLSNYSQILGFFDLLKVTNRWNRFYITPHILTEVCAHIRNDYSKWLNYTEIVHEIMPMLDGMKEKPVFKNDFIKQIDPKNPIIEAGDISIFIIADEFINKKEKISIMSCDRELNKKYQDNSRIMIMDYKTVILNRL